MECVSGRGGCEGGGGGGGACVGFSGSRVTACFSSVHWLHAQLLVCFQVDVAVVLGGSGNEVLATLISFAPGERSVSVDMDERISHSLELLRSFRIS